MATFEDQPQKHIRPRKRGQVTVSHSPTSTSAAGDRVSEPTTTAVPATERSYPKSILKPPRYRATDGSTGKWSDNQPDAGAKTATIVINDTITERATDVHIVSVPSASATTSSSSSLSIEGYTPRLSSEPGIPRSNESHDDGRVSSYNSDGNSTKQEAFESDPFRTRADEHQIADDNILTFNSLSQLLETAGTLPDQNDPSPAAIEADLSFQCMDAETFTDYQRMRQAEYYEACLGRPIGWQLESDERANKHSRETGDTAMDPTDENTDPSGQDDDDDGSLWLGDDEEDEDEPILHRSPRLFAIVWNALAQWVTPQAVAYVRCLRESPMPDVPVQPVYDSTDLGASRCAGLQAQLKMYSRRCWQDELKQSVEHLRLAEHRLGELVRCFDYCRASPSLTRAQTKALACVLLSTVTPDILVLEEISCVPECCAALDMKWEEYAYLTESALIQFGTPGYESCNVVPRPN